MTEVRPLSKALNPHLLPRAPQCRLLQVCVCVCVCVCVPTAPSVCVLGWVKCREHISLLVILCIIEYVTNKAHLSLILKKTIELMFSTHSNKGLQVAPTAC